MTGQDYVALGIAVIVVGTLLAAAAVVALLMIHKKNK